MDDSDIEDRRIKVEDLLEILDNKNGEDTSDGYEDDIDEIENTDSEIDEFHDSDQISAHRSSCIHRNNGRLHANSCTIESKEALF